MSLWGKVARGLLLIFAGVSVLVAIVSPQQRNEALLAAALMTAVALVGVPAVVRFYSSFTGDEDVLERGTPGIATITWLAPTRWRYNRTYPIVGFGLEVQAAGLYPVEIKQAVDPDVLGRLGPGAMVGVRVDPVDRKRVVIDWRQPVRSAGEQVAAAASPTAAPAPSAITAPRSRAPVWAFLRWGFFVFGLIFLRLGCEAAEYETGGVRVQGVVLEKAYSPGTTGSSGSRSSPARYYLRYRFTTTDGQTLEGRDDVLPGTWRKLNEGDPVEVEYVAAAPGTNRIPGQLAGATTWRIMALVLLVASAALFVRQKWKWKPMPM